MPRALKYSGLAVLAIVLMAAILVTVRVQGFLASPLEVPGEGVTITISPGTPFQQVSRQLAEDGLIRQPTTFQWYARLSGRANSIQAGEYTLNAGVTPRELLDMFVAGDVRLHSFTIIEGWTFRELVAALAADPVVVTTISEEDWATLLESLDAEASHPEGLFLPETYRFPRGTTDVDVLAQAYGLLQGVLDDAWATRRADLPLASPYEALILASIVEKETALASERPQIAGVFVRRLNEGMRLQTDPTVIYGIGPDFNGNLTRRDLRTDTPYNTYTRGGLPPTPIAMAGKAAIEAALNPADGTALFFVATGLGDGSHKFSDTKEQHDQAVQEYLARQRANRRQSQGRE